MEQSRQEREEKMVSEGKKSILTRTGEISLMWFKVQKGRDGQKHFGKYQAQKGYVPWMASGVILYFNIWKDCVTDQ